MRKSGRTRAACAALLALGLAACATPPEPVQGDFAIVDVTVIPMTASTEQPHRTVVVKDGRIVAIEAAGARPLAPGVRRIDGSGRWLIPGLADMHVHLQSDDDLPMYVANGVTLVRDMWGSTEGLDRRERVARGTLSGPRIVTAGPLADGDPPVWSQALVLHDAAEACARMAEQQRQGYDFLKIYNNIAPATFDGIVACSHATGFRFAGHTPDAVGMRRMIEGGAWSIEHLTGYDDAERRPDGPFKPRVAYGMDGKARAADRAALARRIQRGELRWEDVFDPQRREELAALAAQRHVWSVPTLITNQHFRTPRTQVAIELQRPEMRYVDPLFKAFWNPDNDMRSKMLSDDDMRAIGSYFSQDLARVAALRRAGAPMLAGTDAPNPFVVPGFSLHDELELLVRAGLTPYEALSAATSRPAESLGEQGRFGTVVVGGRADLVLLSADPLADIAATRRIDGVSLNGRWLSPADLQGLLDKIAAGYAIPDDWFAGMAPPPGAALKTQMAVTTVGVPTGAERYASVAADGGTTLVAQGAGRSGSRYAQTLVLHTGPDGMPESLDYTVVQSAATTALHVRRVGGEMVLEGRSPDSPAIAGRAPAGDAVAFNCDLAACLLPLLPRLRSLAPGESRSVGVLTLDMIPQPALTHEDWTLARDPDPAIGAARIEVHRGKSTHTLRVRWDDRGLAAVVAAGDLGDVETTRRDAP